MERADDGVPKLFLTWRALAVRAEVPDAFRPGAVYEPLAAEGPRAAHVLAFGRGGRVVTVAPRLVLGLARAGGFGATTLSLPPGTWSDRLSGAAWSGAVALDQLLGAFPVALLVRD
jgi:(1->4)-alpha-D-glucan 1-alpha-D-glucosylmutase